jgi:cysteine sulfinate desulfinase/cysteine desulfurase-like protein
MGISDEVAASAIRFSFSHANQRADVDRVAQAMPDIVSKLWKVPK